MIKEALEFLLKQSAPFRETIDGREYANQALIPILDPLPKSLGVNTLTGFVDFFKGCEADHGKDAIVHVEASDQVCLLSPLSGTFCQRKAFLIAKASPPGFIFGQFHDLEGFIIMLQSRFVETEDLTKIIKVVGNVTDSNVQQYTDDGMSQGVTAKVGIVKVDNVPVPRIVKLAPYRTFLEIDQPKSTFLLRMRRGSKDGEQPSCALFESDGGKWKNDAIKAIKVYLEKQLPKNTVILA